MYATNVLGDGYELMFQTQRAAMAGRQHFTESFNAVNLRGRSDCSTDVVPRVGQRRKRPRHAARLHEPLSISLTDAAKQAVAAFDPVTQSVSTGCTPKGMPL